MRRFTPIQILISLCCLLISSVSVSQQDASKQERFWNNIEVYFPEDYQAVTGFNKPKTKGLSELSAYSGPKLPTVVLLHGCGGINAHMKKWAFTLAEAGYLVLMPDAKKIPGFPSYTCSPSNRPSEEMSKELFKLRKQQIGVIRDNIKQHPAIMRKRTFIMGHSEGAATLVQIKAKFFKGAVVSGYKCRKRPPKIDPSVPLLYVNFKTDPWFNGASTCEHITSQRPDADEFLISGHSHFTGENSGARARVLEFLDAH